MNRAKPNCAGTSTVRFGSIVSVNASLTVPTVSEAVSGRAEKVNRRGTAVFASVFTRLRFENEDGQRLVRRGRANRFQSNRQVTIRRVKYANVVGRLLALRVSFRELVCIICSEDG